MADRLPSAKLAPPPGAIRALPARAARTVSVPAGFHNPLAPQPNATPPILLPVIGVDAELTPALERALASVARRAQAGDWAARDALYSAFELKLERFVRRIRVPFLPASLVGLWERDDVAQEGWLVFANLVETWPPAIPFGRYVLANFPWRLRDAVHRGVARRSVPPRMYGIPASDLLDLPDRHSGSAEEWALALALAASLEPPLDRVFRLKVVDQLSMVEIACRLGVSERSATRYWKAVMVRMRADIARR